MSTSTDRLRIILPFLALIAVAVFLSRAFLPENTWWNAVLPWALLALFWLYLGVHSWRERRRGRPGLWGRPPAI